MNFNFANKSLTWCTLQKPTLISNNILTSIYHTTPFQLTGSQQSSITQRLVILAVEIYGQDSKQIFKEDYTYVFLKINIHLCCKKNTIALAPAEHFA